MAISYKKLWKLLIDKEIKKKELAKMAGLSSYTENGIIRVRRTVQRIYVIEDNGDRHTEISIDTPKTKNSIRDIPMTTELLKILKPLKKVVNTQWSYIFSKYS